MRVCYYICMEHEVHRLPNSECNRTTAKRFVSLVNRVLDENEDTSSVVDGMRGIECHTVGKETSLIILRRDRRTPSWLREASGEAYVVEVRSNDTTESQTIDIHDDGQSGPIVVESNEPISRARIEQVAGQLALIQTLN